MKTNKNKIINALLQELIGAHLVLHLHESLKFFHEGICKSAAH